MKTSLAHRFADVNGIRLHYVEAGSGPPVVLLHGFPDFWYGWRHQIRALANAGYRVIAPDLRGYNRSDKPAGLRAYRVEVLMEDVSELLRSLHLGPVTLVGHDWGGMLTWYVAMHRPDVLRRIVILNAAHPAAYSRALRRFSSQLLRSTYVMFFQLPWLPEQVLRARNFGLLRREWRSGPAPGDGHIARYTEAFALPGALSGGINYYRAALRYARPRISTVEVPTLVIWGEGDRFQIDALAEGLQEWVNDLCVRRLPRAGHWSHHTRKDHVNSLLLDALTGTGSSRG